MRNARRFSFRLEWLFGIKHSNVNVLQLVQRVMFVINLVANVNVFQMLLVDNVKCVILSPGALKINEDAHVSVNDNFFTNYIGRRI